jgi:hypothetical protein
MSIRTAIAWAMILGGGLGGISCSSISPAQALKNEQSRRKDQHEGYVDREDARGQKQEEERAFQEQLKRKS